MSEALQREVLSLYQEHGSALFRYAISVARDAELSRDAVQEAFDPRRVTRRARPRLLEAKRA